MIDNYTEYGVANGAKIDVETIENPDARQMVSMLRSMPLHQVMLQLEKTRDTLQQTTLVVPHSVQDDLRFEARLHGHSQNDVVMVSRHLHTIFHLDRFLNLANESLNDNGYLICHSHTSSLKKAVIMNTFPWGLNRVAYACHYLWHRVAPKLKVTQKLYFSITEGKNRTFHRVELLGRLYHAGFEVVNEESLFGEYILVARKAKAPIYGDTPSVSPIIKLRRVGKNGALINVFKFRTMYSYSEYIQPYIYQYQNLATGGKFANDYRVNGWGRLARKFWLDELPMLINVLRGDLKLIGVRPLSRHYFSLYTPEAQRIRVKVKPGLLPPFYYEDKAPETLEEIQASEIRYTEAYLKHPVLTDIRYFFGIMRNILFKHRKSA